jgi:hypothetical protein
MDRNELQTQPLHRRRVLLTWRWAGAVVAAVRKMRNRLLERPRTAARIPN